MRLALSSNVLTLVHDTCMCSDMQTMPRLKKMVSLALDPALLARLDAWLKRQEIVPTKTAVHEAALRRFLDEEERKEKRRKP